MRRIDTFQIRTAREKSVELWQGDVTSLASESPVDAIVISAFPGDYTPTEASVIGAFHRVGISVQDLAVCKDVDLLERFGCWLSRPLPDNESGVRRIICFEPDRRGKHRRSSATYSVP